MYNVPYTLYSVSKANNTMTKLAEGTRGEMGKLMNQHRHVSPKDHRYSIYQGAQFMGGTNN